ncbi:hypothetical protein Tsubulata_011946 [Turnera subulata]|uniref:Homeobox-leucine zipper protein n=1 Tax=Turnera subulata TaxID=218843 RepID=A0A9Q0JRI1_9ROSI|nr:hypothetical protein Tsubulata_011946 [Turnera subulata]
MKRLDSSDSLGALISICPATTEEHSPRNNNNNNNNNNPVYGRDFQSMLDGLDEEGCIEESVHVAEKKRRLSVDQVKALEKNFEVENKLEPERKVKLAQELGLQPRQVAVWFQNRRARWKTKQLERDYGVLKANYDSLKQNYDAVQHDNEVLLKEIRELKAKLTGENTVESNVCIKEEIILPEEEEAEDKLMRVESPIHAAASMGTRDLLNYEGCFDNKSGGSSDDSDSSAILNDDTSPNRAISSSGMFSHHDLMTTTTTTSSPPPSSSSAVSIQFSSKPTAAYQTQFVKMEEHNFFSSEEEACNFFSDEQAPTLQWCCPDQWN